MTKLVTGAAGFIGSNFVDYLATKTDEKIIVVDNITYAGDKENIKKSPQIEFVWCDISNLDHLEYVFSQTRPNHVYHFAAETHVDNSINNLDPFVTTNIIGTINLLKMSLKYGVNKFHHISTDEVFGALGESDTSFAENTPYNPRNPYSASKASSDFFVRAFHETYDLPTVITNCSNNYGPKQNAEKLIPKIICNAFDERDIPIYGDGKNIRDWIYVLDHCEAVYEVSERGTVGERYNIGGECEITNLDLTKKILDIMNISHDIIKFVPDRPGHDFRYSMSNKKIKEELGWTPKYSIDDGLIKTIEYYENQREKIRRSFGAGIREIFGRQGIFY
jgi:dTDP-glucose 4,6-dehydratase